MTMTNYIFIGKSAAGPKEYCKDCEAVLSLAIEHRKQLHFP